MHIASHSSHELHGSFSGALAELGTELIDELVSSSRLKRVFQDLDISATSPWGQVEILATVLDQQIYEIRSAALRIRSPRPAPLDHPALADVAVTSECLVPLAAFDTRLGGLKRNGYVFQVASALPDPLAQHWATEKLSALSSAEVFVRLDPLIVAREAEYRATIAKMWLFGRGLDWNRICTLRNCDFARWLPDGSDSEIRFTDVIWKRRNDGVHFECEEVPSAAHIRAARYLHAILDPVAGIFTHTDFAARFYDPAGLDARCDRHLKDLDKVGIRVKLFRTDTSLSVDTWADLVVSAFVWNDDVKDYFNAHRDFGAEHSERRGLR
jgi:hypothetical protein